MPSFVSSDPSHSSTNLLPVPNFYPRQTVQKRPVSQPSFPSVSRKYTLAADPLSWGSVINHGHPEPDDWLHNPDPKRDKKYDSGTLLTARGIQNIGCLVILLVILVGLFAGYPIVSYFTRINPSNLGGFNIGGLNASGQVPSMRGNWGTIDLDTPLEAHTKDGYHDGKKMQLVFSDEFNVEGRTFYPGEDPYWEAVDLHYWATNNAEWYDPEEVITRDGALEITLSLKETKDLKYRGGMLTSWNKFCFTGGLVETSVTLPGSNNVMGLWPAVWMMGNLGRAGYGATLEGTWPYSYDSCDVGTAPNQTKNGLPAAALVEGDPKYDFALSYLPGQRLSRCTCIGEEHPGPMHEDGTYVGRSAPEIDLFEAQVHIDENTGETMGYVSQSAQFAPFNAKYEWFRPSNMVIEDQEVSALNGFVGNVFQQSLSVESIPNQDCFQLRGTGCFSVFGVEYKPGFDDAYISWINGGKLSWTMLAGGVAPDERTEISARPVSEEPMYLLANLGISENFGTVEYAKLNWPAIMRIDYIRVYQPEGDINIGCDPAGHPTRAYIERFAEAYKNPNLTTWDDDFGQVVPRNSFVDGC